MIKSMVRGKSVASVMGNWRGTGKHGKLCRSRQAVDAPSKPARVRT